MGIEQKDFDILEKINAENKFGSKCAILGDCHFYYNNNNKNEFQKSLGFDCVDTLDLLGNPTYQLNLQEPIPKFLEHGYDVVIDAGTLYCCFDIAAVMSNIFKLLKPEGIIVHLSSVSGHYGRGFYNLHPAFFHDFYKANNFKTIYSASRVKFSQSNYVEFDLSNNYLQGVDKTSFNWAKQGALTEWIHSDSMLLTAFKRVNLSHDKETLNSTQIDQIIKPVPEHYIKTNGK